MTRKDKGTMVPVILLMVFCWVIISWVSDDPEEKENAGPVKERVIEKKVSQEVLNIKAFYTVCHGNELAWAIHVEDASKDDGETWFIVAHPGSKSCTGKEKVHPETRDKVRKEDAELKKKEDKS